MLHVLRLQSLSATTLTGRIRDLDTWRGKTQFGSCITIISPLSFSFSTLADSMASGNFQIFVSSRGSGNLLSEGCTSPTILIGVMEPIDWKNVYSKRPPPFGHALRPFYALDPELLYLNNGKKSVIHPRNIHLTCKPGSFGAAPKPVHQAAYLLSQEIERNPDLFHRAVYQPLLINVRQKLADLLRAKLDEVVLVTNASTGVNTVLRNFHWEEGDILFACVLFDFPFGRRSLNLLSTVSTTFSSVARAAQHISDTPPHPTLVVIPLNFPTTRSQVIAAFEKALSSNPARPNKRRVAIIDGLISNPGVFLPWREMVTVCKRQGVWSVVDAAHSIGQEVGLDLTSAEPDFWLSVCEPSVVLLRYSVNCGPYRIVTNGSLQRGLVQYFMFPRSKAWLAERGPFLSRLLRTETNISSKVRFRHLMLTDPQQKTMGTITLLNNSNVS